MTASPFRYSYVKRNIATQIYWGIAMRGLLMGLALLIAGCSQAPSFDAVAMAKEVVGKSLKDPASAQWGEIEAAKLHEGYVACGTVNSKNSFGGYVGSTPFQAMFMSDGSGGASLADSADHGLAVEASCEILLEMARRNSPETKWQAEKAEIQERVEKAVRNAADEAARR